MPGKYIIVIERGHEVAILFDSLVEHAKFLNCYIKTHIKAAGFFQVRRNKDTGGIEISCYGKSDSLDISSRPDVDYLIIEKML